MTATHAPTQKSVDSASTREMLPVLVLVYEFTMTKIQQLQITVAAVQTALKTVLYLMTPMQYGIKATAQLLFPSSLFLEWSFIYAPLAQVS